MLQHPKLTFTTINLWDRKIIMTNNILTRPECDVTNFIGTIASTAQKITKAVRSVTIPTSHFVQRDLHPFVSWGHISPASPHSRNECCVNRRKNQPTVALTARKHDCWSNCRCGEWRENRPFCDWLPNFLAPPCRRGTGLSLQKRIAGMPCRTTRRDIHQLCIPSQTIAAQRLRRCRAYRWSSVFSPR